MTGSRATLGEPPWLDRPDALERIDERERAGELTGERADALRRWVERGYLVVPGVLDAETVAGVNAETDRFLEERGHLPREQVLEGLQDLFRTCEATRRAMCDETVLRWVDLLLGVRALPYQTLNLPQSSQQGAHSDEILMTTRPQGYLAAAWFALEDIRPDSGPLVVYAGSHRLPYVSAAEVGVPRGAGAAECDRAYDARYYDIVRARLDRSGIEPEPFLGERGDVLLWHSNLLHGGAPSEREGATRRSLIVHYFGEGAEHYSDLYDRRCDLPGLR